MHDLALCPIEFHSDTITVVLKVILFFLYGILKSPLWQGPQIFWASEKLFLLISFFKGIAKFLKQDIPGAFLEGLTRSPTTWHNLSVSLADYSNGYRHCNDIEVLEATFQNILVFLSEKKSFQRHPGILLIHGISCFTFLSPYSTLSKPKSSYLKR